MKKMSVVQEAAENLQRKKEEERAALEESESENIETGTVNAEV
jgi:hypothetical protein